MLSPDEHAHLAKLRLERLKSFYPELSQFSFALTSDTLSVIAHDQAQLAILSEIRAGFEQDAWVLGGVGTVDFYCGIDRIDSVSVIPLVELKQKKFSDEAMTTSTAIAPASTPATTKPTSTSVQLVAIDLLSERANVPIDQLREMLAGEPVYASKDLVFVSEESAKRIVGQLVDQEVDLYRQERLSFFMGTDASGNANGNGSTATPSEAAAAPQAAPDSSSPARPPALRLKKGFEAIRTKEGDLDVSKTINSLLEHLGVTDETRPIVLREIASQEGRGPKYLNDLKLALGRAEIEAGTAVQRIMTAAGRRYRTWEKSQAGLEVEAEVSEASPAT